jgi:hypothetical protein
MKSKKKKKKIRNPHAISAKGRKSGKIKSKKDKARDKKQTLQVEDFD